MPRIGLLLILLTGCGVGPGRPQSVDDSPTQSAPAVTPASLPADKAVPEDIQETESGLKYKIVREGDPNTKPTAANSVVAHYEGWLDDGTVFDSSYERNEPSSFPLSGVIPGWTEGLQLIGEGGEIRLVIPGPLAYPEGRPGIPPGATLHFKVELIEVQ